MGNYLWKQTGLKVTHFRARSVAILRPGALMSYMSYEFHSIWINLSHVVVCTKLTKASCAASLSHGMSQAPWSSSWFGWCMMVLKYSNVLNSSKNVLPKAYCMYVYSNYCWLFIVNAFVPFDGHCHWPERQGFKSLRRHAAAWPLQIPSLISWILLFRKHILDSAVLNSLSDIVRDCKRTDFSNL